jgi:hypothetical protein
MTFTVNVAGQRFMVNCPESAGPGMRVRIVMPGQPIEFEGAPKNQILEVAVPAGVQPGQPFTLIADMQRVLVTCPLNAVPGQKIRFRLPVSQVPHFFGCHCHPEPEKPGWKRLIRAIDLKFQWVCMDTETNNNADDKGEFKKKNFLYLNAMKRFDFFKSAFVRKIHFREGNDKRMRGGYVELVPASEAVVDSRLVVPNRNLMSCSDIARVQAKTLPEKHAWFRNICEQLITSWEDGHMKICVRRSLLLFDSVEAIMALTRRHAKTMAYRILGGTRH